MAVPSIVYFLATAVLSAVSVFSAGSKSYNGLALTPPMGWNNWNAFGCDINEELLLSTAQKIVDFGLRDLGKLASTYPLNAQSRVAADESLFEQDTTTSSLTTAGLTVGHRMARSSPMPPLFHTGCRISQINFTAWVLVSACIRVQEDTLVHNMRAA